MSAYRQIHTRIWQDAWFLDLLPEEKLLFVYLFSNEHASLCGIYELPLKTMAFETGLRTDAITLALDRFGKAGKVLYESPYIWVPNLRKYNANGSPKVAAMLAAQLAEIPDCDLKRRYMAGDLAPLPVAPVQEAPQSQSIPIPYPANRANRASNSNSTSTAENGKGGRSRATPQAHPAVAIFREEAGLYPKRSMKRDIEDAVGSSEDSLALWREVVHVWIARGYKPTNIEGPLQWFKAGGVPERGKALEPKGFQAIRDYDRMAGHGN